MSREGTGTGSPVIEGRRDLLAIFERGAKPESQFRIGIECEKFGVDTSTWRPLSFDGERGIEAILSRMRDAFGWREVRDEGRLIGLMRGTSAITLEPGGQLELSSSPHSSLRALSDEMEEHLSELRSVSQPLGISWLKFGLQPVATLAEIGWVPKSRYKIMRKYYEGRSGRALEMMGSTASIQINVDYRSESDARRKIHVGAALGPVVGAMMANSAVEEGELNGYCSRRLQVWQETDPDRSGVPPFFVDGSFSFERYVDYALDVPMYFVVRDGHYVDRAGIRFRNFLESKVGVGPATMGDWESHLTTLFPDARLKDHLEFRTADANDIELAMALAAFWIGLIYDDSALEIICERVRSFSLGDILSATDDAAMRGLQALMGGEPILRIARDAVQIAALGLSRLDQRSGRHELRYLDPLRDLVEEGKSPAERVRSHWRRKRLRSMGARAV